MRPKNGTDCWGHTITRDGACFSRCPWRQLLSRHPSTTRTSLSCARSLKKSFRQQRRSFQARRSRIRSLFRKRSTRTGKATSVRSAADPLNFDAAIQMRRSSARTDSHQWSRRPARTERNVCVLAHAHTSSRALLYSQANRIIGTASVINTYNSMRRALGTAIDRN